MSRVAVVLLAVVLAGCTFDHNVGVLSTQRLVLTDGKPVTLRAVGFSHVNLINDATDRNLYDGTVTTGDDVVLDAANHRCTVRGVLYSTGLKPGDKVQISVGGL